MQLYIGFLTIFCIPITLGAGNVGTFDETKFEMNNQTAEVQAPEEESYREPHPPLFSPQSSALSMMRTVAQDGKQRQQSAAPKPPLLTPASRQYSLRMSAEDHHGLSAWEKWTRFRRFPFKLILHALLLIAVTSQLLLLNRNDASYQRAMQRTFACFFMPKGVKDGMGRRLLFTNQGFLMSLAEASQNYFRLNELSAVSFFYRNAPHGPRAVGTTIGGRPSNLNLTPTPFKMRLDVAGNYDPPGPLPLDHWVRDPVDLGPFAAAIAEDRDNVIAGGQKTVPPELARLLDSLMSVTLDMVLCNTLEGRQHGAWEERCFCWHVSTLYNFRQGGNAHLTLSQHIISPCSNQTSIVRYLFSRVGILNLITALLASTYLVLILKSLHASIAVYRRVRLAYPLSHHPLRRRYPTWAHVPWRLKRKFFSFYLLLIGLGTLLSLVSVLLSSYYTRTYSPALWSHKLCAGIGALCLWIGVLRFFQPYPHLYSLIPTLDAAAPRLIPFLAGVFPIFFAFALLGVSLFGRDVLLFASLSHTLSSLWSLMNGDSLYNIINASRATHPVLANLYMYTYITLAIYVVINIIIATTEEAFFHSRHVQRLAHRFLKRSLRQLDEMRECEEEERGVCSKGASMDAQSEEEEAEEWEEEEGGDKEGGVNTVGGGEVVSSRVSTAGSSTFPEIQRGRQRWTETEREWGAEEGDHESGSERRSEKPRRGRSDTLFLVYALERQQEEVFEAILRLLVKDYKIEGRDGGREG